MKATASTVRAYAAYNMSTLSVGPVFPNVLDTTGAPYLMKDSDGTITFEVDVQQDDSGWTNVVYIMIFSDANAAKTAPLTPPTNAAGAIIAIPMSRGDEILPSTTPKTYVYSKEINVTPPPTAPPSYNKYAVIWATATSTTNDEYHVHRLPPQGSANGWRIQMVTP
jgi:hypothetical protein